MLGRKTHKKPGRPRKIDQERETKLAEELEKLRGLLEEDDDEKMEDNLREVRALEHKQQQRIDEIEVHNKKLMMWIGIVFIMVVIVIFWMMNIDTITGGLKKDIKIEIKSEEFERAKMELTDTLGEVRTNIDEMKAQAEKIEQEEGIDTSEQVHFLPVSE